MMYAVMGMMAMLGGVVQGVTGFGAGIVMLMALPFYFAIPQATAISSAVISSFPAVPIKTTSSLSRISS